MDEITRELPVELPVDARRLTEFDSILQKYKIGKASVERRTVAAEQWWKLRNIAQEEMSGTIAPDKYRARTGWLHNVIVSKHADAMDNYPEPIILPREPGDRETAKTLSAVLPVIMERNHFERTYSDAWWQKLKTGTAVYQIVWDTSRSGGLGDIAIRRIDLLSVFWEPGVEDIQDSRYFFHCELRDNDELETEFPQLVGKLKGNKITLTDFRHDDAVGTYGKSVVVDVYYKQREGAADVLHYCQYVGDTVLRSTENEGGAGLYAHGKYPFVFDPLWPVEGSPCGYGFVDLCQSSQTDIDMMRTAFVKNTVAGATPRYFQRTDGAINEEEFLDIRKPLVHVNGSVSEDFVRAVDHLPLDAAYISVYAQVIDELRETSGNTETANGISGGGVTAASAIAALQEASGKTSRDATQAGYRAFSDVVELCVELIREFYTLPRQFRITGEQGQETYTMLDNAAMQPHSVYVGSVEIGEQTPLYDIKIRAQRRNAYSRTAQNELAIQLLKLGFFAPQNATQALTALDMMDFEGKDDLMQKLARNGTIMDALGRALDMLALFDPMAAAALAASVGIGGAVAPAGSVPAASGAPVGGGNPIADKARARTAQTTEARGT